MKFGLFNHETHPAGLFISSEAVSWTVLGCCFLLLLPFWCSEFLNVTILKRMSQEFYQYWNIIVDSTYSNNHMFLCRSFWRARNVWKITPLHHSYLGLKSWSVWYLTIWDGLKAPHFPGRISKFTVFFVRKMHGRRWRLWSIPNASITGSNWILSELKLSYAW